jgi:hypothetical protein
LAGRSAGRRGLGRGLDHDGDVAGALADPVRPALGPRPEPLERRALVDVRLGDDQSVVGSSRSLFSALAMALASTL